MYPVVTKSRMKTNKQTSKSKKNMKKKYLNATGLEPTSLSAKNTRLSTRLSGIVINYIQISNCTTI